MFIGNSGQDLESVNRESAYQRRLGDMLFPALVGEWTDRLSTRLGMLSSYVELMAPLAYAGISSSSTCAHVLPSVK
jgi:hypothetical protein